MKYGILGSFFLITMWYFMNSKSGQIILLNGVSSSGKTAIINEINNIDRNIKILKVDDWFPEVLNKKAASLGWKKESGIDPWLYLYNYVHQKTGKYYFNTEVREMLFDEATDFYQKAKELSDSGYNVIIDTVLEYEKEYKTFDDFFKNSKVLKVLVYCPMDILLERVDKRNKSEITEEHRTSFQSFEQFPAIFKAQENSNEQVVDTVKSLILKQNLEKSIQDLIDNKIPDPYLPKLQDFKRDFIEQFKLNQHAAIVLVSRQKYDLILNSHKTNPEKSAKEIILLINSSNAKMVIKQYDSVTISQVLNREIPDLTINSIKIIETGWDHLVAEVNGEWIFRFPRTEGSIINLEREKKLLNYLNNHITLPIPDYHYFGKETALVGYRKIQGVHINKPIYDSLDHDVRQNIAQTLALFFTQLHHAVTKEQALQWGYTNVIRPLDEIESMLLGTLPTEIDTMLHKALVCARKNLSKERDLVFIHQDVNGDNLAFNQVTGQITGIFDFSDAGIAHYSMDFAEMFVVSAELATLTAEIYAKMNNVSNPLLGGAADYILRKATLMLEARKKGNTQDEVNLLKVLGDFLPMWRAVL